MYLKLHSCCYEHDERRSYYNHNYYKLKNYGDWLWIDGDLYVYEVCHEDENCYTASLGYFDNDKFVSILCCTNTDSVLEN